MDLSKIDRSSSYYELKYDWKPEKEYDMINALVLAGICIYCIILAKVIHF